MNARKRESICQLPAHERYGYLMRKAADTEAIWVIRDGSQMVMLGEGTAKKLIPVWPEKAFAEHHLTGTWAGYRVEEMAVDDFLDWLDQLQKEGVGIAAFPKEDL